MQAMPNKPKRGTGAGSAALVIASLLALSAPANAQAATEIAALGDYTVTLHLHAFLSPQDLEILRLIAADQQYLAMFVPQAAGFSALAASPEEGFVKDAAPVPSAVALGGLPDAATAAADSIAACQKIAASKTPCVVILEVAPK